MATQKTNKNTLTDSLYNKTYLEVLPHFKEQKAQAFLNLILTLITFTFFGIFAISPTLSTISQLQKQLADSKFADQKLQEKIANLSSLQTSYNLLTNDIPIVLSALPENPTVPLLFAYVNATAQESHVIIDKVQSLQVELNKPKEQESQYSSFKFSIIAEGSYQDIMNFLSSLTNFNRIVSIDNIALTKAAKTGVQQITINGIAYFKK